MISLPGTGLGVSPKEWFSSSHLQEAERNPGPSQCTDIPDDTLIFIIKYCTLKLHIFSRSISNTHQASNSGLGWGVFGIMLCLYHFHITFIHLIQIWQVYSILPWADTVIWLDIERMSQNTTRILIILTLWKKKKKP